MNIELPIIGTPSRTELSARCHRRHFVGDVLCLRKKDRDECHVSVGTVVHAGAAKWWSTGSVDTAMFAAREEYAALEQWMTIPEYTPEFVCEHLIRRYTEQASIAGIFEPEGWEILSIEERIVLPLGPEATISFQLDRLVQDEERRLVLVDTKTTSRIDKRWKSQWLLNLQQKLYSYSVREVYGRPLAAHFIEGLEKSPKATLEYVPLPLWSDGELQEAASLFRRLVQRDAALVAEAMGVGGVVDLDRLFELAVTVTDFNPHDCFSYGRECELFKICTAPVEERVGLLKDEFEWVQPTFLE
jgi:PD-(D/E)XK nuclease superfamily protein